MTIGVASDGRGSRFGAQPGLWSELPLRVLADLDQQPRFRVLRPSTRPVVRASNSGAAEASGASRLTPIGEGARLIHHGRNTLLLLRRLVKLEENSAAVPALTSRRPRVATLSFRLTSVLSFQLNDRRCLRLLEEADADELYAVVGANRGYLAEWMPWAAGQTLADTLEFIRNSRKQLADNQGFQTAIVDDGRIVGVLGFHRIDWENRSTSIGYWIAESSQGRGTVTQAVRALADHAFRTWKLNRIEIQAGVDNERSRAIPARLGFKEEGVLRQAERVGDRFVDHVVYAVLTEDWRMGSA